MMLSHFYHHHLLLSVLSCDKQDLYFALQEKIKSWPIAARGGRVGSSTFDRRALGFAWRHPAAPRSSSRNAQRCSESKTAASPIQSLQKHRISFKRSSSASTPSSSIRRGLPTCMRDPLFFPFDSCSFPVAIYYSRIFPIFSSESFEFCWPLRSHIVFNWRAPSQSHEWGRFPHHLLLIISVQPEQNRATGYRCVLHSVSRLLRRIDAPQTFISSWFHIQKQHICVSRIGQTRASLKLLYKKWWPVGQCSKTGFSPIRIITINRRTWSLIPPIPAKDPWRPRRRPAAPNAQTQEVRANCCLHRQLTWQWISDSSQRQVLWCKSQWERWKQNRSWHIHSFLISTEHLSI